MSLVAGQDIDQVNLLALPAREWKGVFRIEGSSDQTSRAAPRVTLEPRSERGAIAEEAPRFNAEPFPVTLMPDETYDVFVARLRARHARKAGFWAQVAGSSEGGS